MSDRDALSLIFASGFSTAATISDISGRGVGMDIVKSNLEKLGGRILVDSRVGEGSRFTIHLPLTLAIVRALLVAAGGGTYVLPLVPWSKCCGWATDEGETPRRAVGGQAVIEPAGAHGAARLVDVLCGDPGATRSEPSPTTRTSSSWASASAGGPCVDALVGEQEMVIKSLGTLLGDIAGLAGATILADGRVALIVDVAKAIESIQAAPRASQAAHLLSLV